MKTMQTLDWMQPWYRWAISVFQSVNPRITDGEIWAIETAHHASLAMHNHFLSELSLVHHLTSNQTPLEFPDDDVEFIPDRELPILMGGQVIHGHGPNGDPTPRVVLLANSLPSRREFRP